ncbi:Hypothetical protein Minf_1129 [Methylacidiphilum infernorum V4]|uniref:Uncharacterized protein n=1 Tax=Methylacidiphilum infernorum (isolate V4) TaxID=481448 RepID=B3DV31_METI4|nr:Hypothetical protein Minf_1129 [Methylacidiphilum infernorum V4]
MGEKNLTWNYCLFGEACIENHKPKALDFQGKIPFPWSRCMDYIAKPCLLKQAQGRIRLLGNGFYNDSLDRAHRCWGLPSCSG